MEHVSYLAEKGSAAYELGRALGPVCLLVCVVALLYGAYRLLRRK
jgi:hypothetical protein